MAANETAALWRETRDGVEVAFAGQGWPRDTDRALEVLLPPEVEAARLQQIHSDRVLEADRGLCGKGDGLITERTGLALCVITADCVPVLLASADQIAAVHAGWRGLAQEILAAAIARFDAAPQTLHAWIGPAIGACCYEVGEEVAAQVQRVTPGTVTVAGRGERPHLDLPAAAEAQLTACGVRSIHRVDTCTRCGDRRWYSYRRSGAGAGRNLACIWRG